MARTENTTATSAAISTAPTASPTSRPTLPPTRVTRLASVRNCRKMSRWRAPTAMRMPISRVRSLTVISITFITPIPPTTSETAAIRPSIMAMLLRVAASAWMRAAALPMPKSSRPPWRAISSWRMAVSAAWTWVEDMASTTT